MFSSNHRSFMAVEKEIVYKVEDMWRIASSAKEIFSRQELFILIANNDIFSLSVYLKAIESRTPIMILNNDIDPIELEKIVKKFKPNFLLAQHNYTFSSSSDIKEMPNDYYLHSFSFKKLNLKINKELAVLLPTSGSTGSAKFVRLSFFNILSNANSIKNYLQISKSDTTISTLPMSYSFGLSIINTYFDTGAKIILTNQSIVSREFWKLINNKDHQITSISGVPYIFELLYKLGFFKKEYPFLKTITQAGGRLKIELKKKILEYASKRNINFFVMYGQTEATARIAFVPPEKLADKIDSIGIPIPGINLTIESNQSDQGEIICEGPNVSLGYASEYKDLLLGDKNKGKLRTGDIGYQDSDGYFFITGRRSRFIKINSVRLSLDDAEQLIENNFPNIDVRCIGNDENLVVEYSSTLNHDKELQLFISKRLKIHYKYLDIKKVEEISRNASGKKIYN